MPTFILDTNVFVQAHRRYYAFDLCPGFWGCLEHHCAARLVSIDRVRDEIAGGDADALANWVATTVSPDLFVSTNTDEVLPSYAEVMRWAQTHAEYTPAAKAEFAQVADAWLVAYARVIGGVVVSEEVFNPHKKNRILVPNACQQFGIPCINTFDMLRQLPAEFSWAPPPS
jgi:hypothetical protein